MQMFDLPPSLPQDPRPDRHRSASDLVAMICSVVVFFVMSTQLELAERLSNWTHKHEYWQLDEIPLSLLVLALALVWFGWRRWRELNREMLIRSQLEARNLDALAQNRRLAQELIHIQESERRFIASELHDEFGQYCVVIKVDAALVARESLHKQATIYASAQRISEAADHLHQVLRGMLRRLRPTGLDDLGLIISLQLLVEGWQAQHRIACTFKSHGSFDALDEACTIALYRSVQEGLTNIAKHAQASLAQVTISHDTQYAGTGQIVLTVVDNGVGLQQDRNHSGLGVLGMRERVSALGGKLSLDSPATGGTQLKVVLPMRGTAAAP